MSMSANRGYIIGRVIKMQYLTVKQMAEILQVSQRTIYRLIDSGKLPAYKLDRDWRIAKEDINQFLEKRINRQILGK